MWGRRPSAVRGAKRRVVEPALLPAALDFDSHSVPEHPFLHSSQTRKGTTSVLTKAA